MLRFIIDPNGPEKQVIELEARTVLVGSSDENDLILTHDTILSHHCRIEEKEGICQIVDLGGKGDLEVDGEVVEKRADLPFGSLIRIGDVVILFKGSNGEPVPGTIEDGEIITSEVQEDHALVMTPGGGTGYLPSGSFIQPMTIAPEKASAGMLPMLSLILSILGPVLFGIGLVLSAILGNAPIFFYGIALFLLLVGIVFGFMSRAMIRRRGGFLRDQQVASWGLYMSFGWLIVFSGVLGYFGYANTADRRISNNEKKIKHVLVDIAVSQAYIKYAILIDDDRDLIGEYANPKQFGAVKYSKIPTALAMSSAIHGYIISFENIGEDSFLITAIPESYKSTGKKSYYIDQEGYLCGEDIDGKDPATYEGKNALPRLSQDKSVYEIYGDELAGDIFQVLEDEMQLAAKDPENEIQHRLRANTIAGLIRKQFPLSRIVSQLNDIDKANSPVIVDFRASEEFSRAMALLDEDKPLHALEVLRKVETQYPTASNIIDIRDQITKIRDKHLKELEAEAKRLYDDAKKKELEGDFGTAFENYKTIRDKYVETSYAKEIDDLVEKTQAKIKEKETEKYIAELRSLSVDKDYERIISLAEVMKRGYEMTEVYSRNLKYIEGLKSKAQAHLLVAHGNKSFKEKDYRAALQTFEKAIEEDPDIRTRLKTTLELCYVWCGKYALDEKDYRKALSYFTAYRRSNPEVDAQTQEYLSRALPKTYFEVGKLDYQQGNFEDAEKKLFAAAQSYIKHPEFNYIYGSVLLERKHYRRAMEVLTKCIQDKSFQVKALRKRGYASIEYAFELEDKLRDLLLETEEYQYLIDLDKLKAGIGSHDSGDEEQDQKEEEDEEDSEKDEEDIDSGELKKRNFKEKMLKDSRGPRRRYRWPVDDPDDRTEYQEVLAQSDENMDNASKNYPLFRILTLIEEIEKKKADIAKEEFDVKGDKAKRKLTSLKKTRMVREFEAKYASIKVSLDKENTNKELILHGIKTISGYLRAGSGDINKAALLSISSQEVKEAQAQINYKLQMYNVSYQHLFFSQQNEKQLQANAIKNLNIALDQFKGWGKRVDISRSLKYAFLMTPSKEAVARGLSELIKALEVEVNTSVILGPASIEGN